MKALDGAMAAVFSKTGEGLSAFQKQTEGLVGDIDKQMAQAVRLLSKSVSELADASGQNRIIREAAE
jgi:hypothetical protein